MKTIVCFGDSNTHGYCSVDGGRFSETQRWTCLLNDLLGSDYDVKEEGLSGRSTVFEDPLTEGLSGVSMISNCLLTHEPVDLLIVMLGTNDTKQRFHATPENIAVGMERLLRKAIATPNTWRNQPNILLITPPPMGSEYRNTIMYGEMGDGCSEKSKALAPLFEDVAKRLGCHYVNAADLPGVTMAHYDHMHLGEESHKRLAEELAEIVPGIV